MNATVGRRAPLVLGLALASLGRLAGRTPAGIPGVPRSGPVVSVAPTDGAVLVDTVPGPVLLLITWDATVRGPHGPLCLEDVRVGDVVEWTDETGQSVAMVETLRVLPAGAR